MGASAQSSPSGGAKTVSNAASQRAAPGEANAFAGQWFLPEGDGILVISAKGEWLHPTHGTGRIQEAKDDADIKVFYNSGGARCSYRAGFADGGKTLILFAADNTQFEPLPVRRVEKRSPLRGWLSVRVVWNAPADDAGGRIAFFLAITARLRE